MPGIVPRALSTLPHLQQPLEGRCYSHPHFTDDITEAGETKSSRIRSLTAALLQSNRGVDRPSGVLARPRPR